MSVYLPWGKPQTRRIKRLQISLGILLELLRHDGTRLIKTDDIPDDAQVVGISVDEMLNTAVLYIESKQFEEVSEGSVYPDLNVMFTEYSALIETPSRLVFEVGEAIVQQLYERRQKAGDYFGHANG